MLVVCTASCLGSRGRGSVALASRSAIVHASLVLWLWLWLWLALRLLCLLLLLLTAITMYHDDLVAALCVWYVRVLIVIGNLGDDIPGV